MTLWACHAASALAGWEEGDAAWNAGRYEQAWTQLKPLAEAGDANAQNRVGVMLADGKGVAKDEREAFRWFERAARKGLARAQYNLGLAYLDGEGTAQDAAQALHWIGAAARQGDADAQVMFGYLHERGIGTRSDPAEAVRWYRKAADAGSLQGQFRLAWAHLEGEGVAEDANTACELFKQTAQAGFAPGMREYGQRLERGEGCPQDLDQARQWYERAAAKDDVRAMYLLGVLHDFGRGVPTSKGHAVYWYFRAARRGHADARNDLGVMYRDGEFVAQDPAIAAALFRLAAQDGQENGRRNGDKIEGTLDAPSRKRVAALVEALREPAGFDAVLNDSLAAAQGLSPAAEAATAIANPASPCVPTPALPTSAQFQAWYRDQHDRGPLWRITKEGRTSWLYGTIHVGRANWLVPGPRIAQALLASDVLALESDPGAPSTQAAMARAQERMLALDKPQHQAELDAALGAACASALRQQGTPQVMQALLVSMRDAAAERQYAAFGVEMLLKELAKRRQKELVELESADETLTTLVDVFSIGEGTRLQADLEIGPERRVKVLRRLSRDWETGDVEDMERYPDWCECADDALARAATERLIDARNPAMAERIDALHRQGKRVLAAVGALHMAGPRGLPALLAARGYQVERVTPQRPLPAPLDEIRVDVPQAQTVARR